MEQQSHHQPGQISLSVLIDMIVQRTYHELTILAELLPRKTDMERKVEIFNFASRTRMLFIRLLALVKWASSASKVELWCANKIGWGGGARWVKLSHQGLYYPPQNLTHSIFISNLHKPFCTMLLRWGKLETRAL